MRYQFLASVFLFSFFFCTAQHQSLNGIWQVSLQYNDNIKYSITLPGTLDDAGIGIRVQQGNGVNFSTMAHLTRKVEYVGKAFYERSFIVPKIWNGKRITLKLGRVLWKSTVYIDNQLIKDSGESLTTSHEFDLTDYVIPGKKQRIKICIDNSNLYAGINVYASQYQNKESREIAHAYTNHTQIKWNGILGEVSLIARPKIFLSHQYVESDLDQKRISIIGSVNNVHNDTLLVKTYVVNSVNGKKWNSFFEQVISGSSFIANIQFDKDVVYWDEFTPQLYKLVTIVKSKLGADTSYTDFGLRNIKSTIGDLFLNNKRIFIRGNLECIIFPLTGYPPMGISEWEKLYKMAKSYGLNSFRFHSWCPPQAAFVAADKVGFYLQVELPNWNLKTGVEDTASFSFLIREADRILTAYGNHPSFLFFSMGNELEGDFSKLNSLVNSLKQNDKRHLYTTTTFTFQKDVTGAPQPADDFYVTQWTKKGWVRGQGVFNDLPPNFSKDYSTSLEGLQLPVITHEIGQYSVFPDISEIKEYKGNLLPVNFIAVREALKEKGLLALAPAYLQASGKFATILYKEEIERALKTKGLDGFQLLQMQDFPGQGTALVGILNAFWKSKGFADAKEFRKYNSELTPLLRFEKAVYQNDEIFEADVELANFYKPLANTELVWSIKNESGALIKSGAFGKKSYPIDNGIQVGKIKYDLSSIKRATKLLITINVNGTKYSNDWTIWVYPKNLDVINGNVLITTSYSEALGALTLGKKVLLCPVIDTLVGPKGKFVPVFWSPIHFPDNPGTMGLLIKSKHKSLADFPTDDFSNWQWWDLTTKGKALKVNNLADEANIVRQIDNFVTNQNLSSLFEVRVGKGKLIFCGIDIITDLSNRPQAKQLKYSLLKYMNTNAFNPIHNYSENELSSLFK